MFNTVLFRTAGEIYSGFNSVEKKLNKIVKDLKADNILLVTDEGLMKTGLVEKVIRLLEYQEKIETFCDIESDPSIDTAQKCVDLIRKNNYNLIIALGGGSVIDISKVSAAVSCCNKDVMDYMGSDKVESKGLPLIAIPTTSGTGSEVTDRAILSDKREQSKKGLVSKHLLPDVAIIDPQMTKSLPPFITAYTGIDALTHLIEAYVASNASEMTDALALQGIRLIGRNLRKAVGYGNDLNARHELAMASLMGGMAFNNAGLGAVHALALPVGAHFGVPHGIANAVLLPYVMEFNCVSNTEKFARVAEALGENIDGLSERDAARRAFVAVKLLTEDVGIPTTLAEVDADQGMVDIVAGEAFTIKRLLNTNPRNVKLKDLEKILNKAFTGF